MAVFENYPAIHLGGLSNRFHRKLVLCFQEQKKKTFCFENVVFLHFA